MRQHPDRLLLGLLSILFRLVRDVSLAWFITVAVLVMAQAISDSPIDPHWGVVLFGAAIACALASTLLSIGRRRDSTTGSAAASAVAVLNTEETRFRRWVEVQASPGEDLDDLARQLSPTWTQWTASHDLSTYDRARHEAAHAVVAWVLGHTVTQGDIMFKGHVGGHVDSVPPLPSRGHGPDLWDALTIGEAANVLDLTEGRRHMGSMNDIQVGESRAAALISTGWTPEENAPFTTIAQTVTAARERAAFILDGRTSQIDALADALIERRALGGRRIHDILEHEEHIMNTRGACTPVTARNGEAP